MWFDAEDLIVSKELGPGKVDLVFSDGRMISVTFPRENPRIIRSYTREGRLCEFDFYEGPDGHLHHRILRVDPEPDLRHERRKTVRLEIKTG